MFAALSTVVDAAPRAAGTGTLVSGAVQPGFALVDAADGDAKLAIDAGGFLTRAVKQPKDKAATSGAAALPGLPVDPSEPRICAAASSGTAEKLHGKLESADVVRLKLVGKVCRARISIPGSKLISDSYTWLLAPIDKLGVQVVCTYLAGDPATEAACSKFAATMTATKTASR